MMFLQALKERSSAVTWNGKAYHKRIRIQPMSVTVHRLFCEKTKGACLLSRYGAPRRVNNALTTILISSSTIFVSGRQTERVRRLLSVQKPVSVKWLRKVISKAVVLLMAMIL